ncbi:MAG: hypothetical protein FWG71_00795 [Synergistaceae bacterium]|nr:hypothetical protein [Synergistaceae bacterium]
MQATEGAEIMTNEQWFGVLRMVVKIIKRCETTEEAVREIEDLLQGDKNYEGKRDKPEN